ncbi:MAG: hypothetical protein R2932_44260 [Caldilineaceae bacterium]
MRTRRTVSLIVLSLLLLLIAATSPTSAQSEPPPLIGREVAVAPLQDGEVYGRPARFVGARP